MSIILIPIVSYEILKFISYYELDDLLPIFNLNANDRQTIKQKIYKQRLTITKYNHRIEYRLEGKLHQENELPAIEHIDGSKEWLINGKRHRLDGPALDFKCGYKAWWVNKLRHRENDLPAVELADGTLEWWVNGKLHRENGPAVIRANGSEEWWVEGKQVR